MQKLRFRINILGGRRGRFFTGVSIAWTSVGGDFWTISGAAKEWPPCYFEWLEFAGQTMRTTSAQFVAAPAAANKKSPVVVAASKYLQNFPLLPNTVPANWRWWGGCSYKCIDRSWVSFCISTLNRSYGRGWVSCELKIWIPRPPKSDTLFFLDCFRRQGCHPHSTKKNHFFLIEKLFSLLIIFANTPANTQARSCKASHNVRRESS